MDPLIDIEMTDPDPQFSIKRDLSRSVEASGHYATKSYDMQSETSPQAQV